MSDTRPQLDICQSELKNTKYNTSQRVGAIPLSYGRYRYDVTHYEDCISSNYWIIEKDLVSEVSNKWHTPVLGVFWDCNWLWFEEGWDTDDLLRWLLITLRAVDWTTCFEILKSAIRPASFSTKPTRLFTFFMTKVDNKSNCIVVGT